MSANAREVERAHLLRAIQIESRNAGVYDSLAQLFQGYDDPVTAIFREMAAEERQHGAELERRYHERYGPVPTPGAEPKDVIEAPDMDDPEALVFDSMTIEQAIELGLKAERMAREFYQREVGRTTDPALQQLYRELSEFEEDHVRRLEQKLEEKRRTAQSPPR